MTRSHVRYKNSQDKLDEVSDKLDATAKLALDFAIRGGFAVRLFPTGAAKQKCLEILEGYPRDRAEVLAGAKEKGFSF